MKERILRNTAWISIFLVGIIGVISGIVAENHFMALYPAMGVLWCAIIKNKIDW